MEVDINGDGDFDDPNETQLDTFSITVVDEERPEAICIEVDIQLDNMGSATVFARERLNEVYIDAGSTDNCGIDSMALSQSSFGCGDVTASPGVSVTLSLLDAAGNSSTATSKALEYITRYSTNINTHLVVPFTSLTHLCSQD